LRTRTPTSVARRFRRNWPLVLVTTVTFDDDGARTRATLTWTAENATEIEIQTFAANMPAMDQGWTGRFDQLDTSLA
jgi:Activator of Hsp90 ATPase homolog 1-like protein